MNLGFYVCPLNITCYLDLDPIDFTLFNQIVRAHDNTRREVLRMITLEVKIKPIIFVIEFQVLDIVVSFNLLLG